MTPRRLHLSGIVLESRGFHNLMNKTYQQAIHDLTEALNLGRSSSEIYWRRALAYMGLQEWNMAQADLAIEGVTEHFQEDFRTISELQSALGVVVPRKIVKCLATPCYQET